MDCKAHRKIKHLEIKSLHLEQHRFDEDMLIAAFVAAVKQFRQFQQCDSVSLTTAYPKQLTGALKPSLAMLG